MKSRRRAGRATARRWRLAVVAACLSLLLIAATSATAQVDDPNATGEQAAKENDLDTDITPVAKKSDLWTLVHGAPYPKTELVADSVTSFDTELHAVSFRNRAIGLAGGSACAITPIQEKGEEDKEFAIRASECTGTNGASAPRVPVIYRYDEPRNEDPGFDRLPLPGDSDPGYIGAIDWIDSDRALIVGGSGTYPRREPAADGKASTDPAKSDPAGKARAWIYTRADDSVEELDIGRFTAHESDRAGMRGFSAVGCFRDPTPGQFSNNGTMVPDPNPEIEACFAGGLGQLWEWRAGSFTGKQVDAASPSEDLADASLFRYRVRDIAFTALEPPVAVAVTAGCCAPIDDEKTPRLLVYNDDTKHPRRGPIPGDYEPGPARWFARSFVDRVGEQAAVPSEADNSRRERNDTPLWPDSIYSVMAREISTTRFEISAILSPGGQSAERPSVITDTYAQSLERGGPSTSPPEREISRIPLSTARLVDGDGDVAGADPLRPSGMSPPKTVPSLPKTSSSSRDGVPDWVVGELGSSSRDGLGPQGLLVATALSPTLPDAVNARTGWPASLVPTGFNCPPGNTAICRPTPDEVVNGWEPLDEEKLATHLRSQHFLLPSYSANAIEIVGDEEDGWIVGDRGAIMRLSSKHLQSTVGATEPPPPRLGQPRRETFSERGAYEPTDELSRPGTVPPLDGETLALEERRMVPAGTLGGSAREIVMSRDGSEGWAVGSDGKGPTFARFDGVDWRRCDPVEVEGAVEADPACADMAPLRGYRDTNGNFKTVPLDHIVRVPLEADSDPTNDDELEIVALGGSYSGPENGGKNLPAFVRYRDGRWRFEDASPFEGVPSAEDLAFTSPDEGWMWGAGTVSGSGRRVFHFDGATWTDCQAHPAACGDSGNRLPEDRRDIGGLTVAGDRVYLYGSRRVDESEVPVASSVSVSKAPLILYKDPGGQWTDGSGPGEDGAGLDPLSDGVAEIEGHVSSLSMVGGSGGPVEGWAVGSFGSAAVSPLEGQRVPPPQAALLRLAPGGEWSTFSSPGALEDYMLPYASGTRWGRRGGSRENLQVSYPFQGEAGAAYIGQEEGYLLGGGRTFGFDAERGHFKLLDSARPQGELNINLATGAAHPAGELEAMAPDGRGGFWASVSGGRVYHYTDRPERPVFEETASPFGIHGAELRDLAAGPDGSVWAATDPNRLFRYQRGLGWEQVRIPGWDPGRVVTRASKLAAIALGPDGEGLAVGEGGRIARLSPEAVGLDPAAGRSCALGDAIPCGTSRDLKTVDIAPDGSAIAGGDRLALIWRPAGGEFREIAKPSIASSTRIDAVSHPAPGTAYLLTNTGVVFRGEMSVPGVWSWRVELAADAERGESPFPLRDLAVDGAGHGYAVGAGGVVFERTSAGAWRRIAPPTVENLSAVELPEGGGEGVLIGGAGGLILTGSGSQIEIARRADFFAVTGPVAGLAYLPGSDPGSVDAWAGITATGEGDGRLFRYQSDPGDARLNAAGATSALADAPAAEDALTIAAFGKADCEIPKDTFCPEMTATTTTNETVTQRIVDELGGRDELDLAVLSGDATDSAGREGSSVGDYDRFVSGEIAAPPATVAGQFKHRRFAELVVERLEDGGVPLVGAVGGGDLTETLVCDGETCTSAKQFANAGENYAWREAFAGRAEPWGDGSDMFDAEEEGAIGFEPAPGSSDNSLRTEDQRADADGEGAAPKAKAEIGGANTHYAVDAVRDGEPIARIVFVDTSMRSLAASDPLQQPHELGGGQQRFLERMICKEGQSSTFGDRCTREKDQKAIVVSNTPTYSYGPGALTHTATDATTFEATMLRYDVDLVVSGALGYNGLYYTLAPGLHEPCPGAGHPDAPPTGDTPDCLDPATSAAGVKAPDPNELASVINAEDLRGAYPTLIASGAGGKFGPDGTEGPSGPEGRWHGYSVARLMPDGDIVVEQRPILDWIGLEASRHTVRPRQKLLLNGYGRSPISTTTEGLRSRAFHYEISTAAITHRYDLLRADPEKPWLPLEDSAAGAEVDGAESCEGYVCLPDEVATVDSQSGQVKAGSGKHPPTYAVAMLSVGEEVATTPLFFEPSPSFRFEAPTAPRPTPAVGVVAAPGSPTSPPTPSIPNVSVPTPPVPPALVPPPPAPPATPPQPPVPPPVPPANAGPSALSLSFAPTGLVVAPTASVIPPPAPPINPAPPGGARKEARQRQAATQKSGADNDSASEEGSSESSDADTTQNRPGVHGASRNESAAGAQHAFARRGTERSEPSFTPVPRATSASGSSAALQWGAGLTLGALALALGFTTLRPRSRRREPELPAPAYSRLRSRR